LKLPTKLKPELVFYSGATLLEGPCWDPKEEVVYCVAIEQSLVYRINFLSREVTSYQTNGPVGCVVIDNNGMLLTAEKNGIYKINSLTQERTLLIHPEDNPLMRYNDGKLDPLGRFIFGTMGENQTLPNKGKLFSYDGNIVKTIIEGITISNGIGFSNNGEFMYFIDTPTKKVARYFYNLKLGEANFDKYIIEIDGEGYPDGMCVDIDDNLWIAEWEGGKVCKWNSKTGEKLNEITLPCKRVTSCCLGGDNLDSLFITTAKKDKYFEPLAGGLFKLKIH